MPWTGLLRHRPLRAALVVGVMCPAGYEVFLFVLPVNGTRIGLSASTIGSILGASALAIIAVRMLMPLLVRRVRDWTIIMTVFLCIAVSFLMLAVVTQTWVIFLIAVLMGLAQGLGQPLVMSMFYTASPEGRQGEAAGVRGVLQNAFSTFSPVVIGGLGTFLGLGPVLAAAAAVYAWGGWFARRQLPP
jgi:cyanate permease